MEMGGSGGDGGSVQMGGSYGGLTVEGGGKWGCVLIVEMGGLKWGWGLIVQIGGQIGMGGSYGDGGS